MYKESNPVQVGCQVGYAGQENRTISENIDLKITALRNEIERLEKSKESLAPLMAMRIRDIREAMNY